MVCKSKFHMNFSEVRLLPHSCRYRFSWVVLWVQLLTYILRDEILENHDKWLKCILSRFHADIKDHFADGSRWNGAIFQYFCGRSNLLHIQRNPLTDFVLNSRMYATIYVGCKCAAYGYVNSTHGNSCLIQRYPYVQYIPRNMHTVSLCCALLWLYVDCFSISIRLTSLALWQSNDCPSASKATLMNMNKYFTWVHYERLHNHNKAKHNKTVCIFLWIYCTIICKSIELLGT